MGVDTFLESNESATAIGQKLQELCANSPFLLKMISNRGVQVYPETGGLFPDTTDHWRARFLRKNNNQNITDDEILTLLKTLGSHYSWMHIEKLFEFNHEPAFTKAQGES